MENSVKREELAAISHNSYAGDLVTCFVAAIGWGSTKNDF